MVTVAAVAWSVYSHFDSNRVSALKYKLQVEHDVGYWRENIFQDKDKYVLGTVKLTLSNRGRSPAQNVHGYVLFESPIWAGYVYGNDSIEYERHESQWRPLDSDGASLPGHRQLVNFRLPKLVRDMRVYVVIVFLYPKGTDPSSPKVLWWCDDGFAKKSLF